MSNPKVCILVCDLAPYHEARFNAAAALGDLVVLDVGKDIDTAYDAPEQLRFPIIQVGPAKLEAQLTEIRPDVLVVPGWANQVALRSLLWCVRHGCPIVVLSDSQLEGLPRTFLQDFVKRQLMPIFSAALVAGVRSQRYMEHFGMPAEALYQGVDVVDNEHFARGLQASPEGRLEQRARLDLPERYILSVGRLVPVKNISGLISAFAEYVKDGHHGGLELVIVGDGPLHAEFESQIRSARLEQAVHLYGRADYESLPRLYQLADAFVMNSHSETWGLAVNEAMSAACPALIPTSCGCSEDLIRNRDNGFVFEVGDEAVLSRLFGEIGAGRHDLNAMGLAAQATIRNWDVDLFARNFWGAVNFAQQYPSSPGLLSSAILRALLFKSAIR